MNTQIKNAQAIHDLYDATDFNFDREFSRDEWDMLESDRQNDIDIATEDMIHNTDIIDKVNQMQIEKVNAEIALVGTASRLKRMTTDMVLLKKRKLANLSEDALPFPLSDIYPNPNK